MGKNEAGERLWAGLGATATEDAMIDEMVSAYNHERNAYDHETLKQRGIERDDGTFTNPEYDPASGSFDDTVTKEDILKSQIYAIQHHERKGGFMATAGKALDEAKVKSTRGEDL